MVGDLVFLLLAALPLMGSPGPATLSLCGHGRRARHFPQPALCCRNQCRYHKCGSVDCDGDDGHRAVCRE
ncbi:hypothetical protein NGR_c04700 [Sinorhizobium fredii NGR234]|uniref:Uncharacterized protein n=1 Tax=Sinorhizobium fredii (strain NBRC 101917 / NGR234) TaxID=394 RepID=C3MHD8_SINFN|nr:hypothetical protein NGR_c04700 [Sinorhizobium fredii NGR234]